MGYLAYMRANRPGWSRMHWRSRSRDASIDHFGAKHEAFDLPIPLCIYVAGAHISNIHGENLLRKI